MQVLQSRYNREQRAHAGHRRPHVVAGTTVWVIMHDGRYFYYAYLTKEKAERVMARLLTCATEDRPLDVLVDFNFRREGPGAVADPPLEKLI